MDELEEEHEFLTVEEARQVLRIGRTQAWLLVNRGVIPSVRLGEKTVRVPAAALRQLVQGAASPVGRTAR